jgi:hypothetical protein
MNTFSFQPGNSLSQSKGCKDFKAAEQQRKHETAPAHAGPRFVYHLPGKSQPSQHNSPRTHFRSNPATLGTQLPRWSLLSYLLVHGFICTLNSLGTQPPCWSLLSYLLVHGFICTLNSLGTQPPCWSLLSHTLAKLAILATTNISEHATHTQSLATLATITLAPLRLLYWQHFALCIGIHQFAVNGRHEKVFTMAHQASKRRDHRRLGIHQSWYQLASRAARTVSQLRPHTSAVIIATSALPQKLVPTPSLGSTCRVATSSASDFTSPAQNSNFFSFLFSLFKERL